MAEKSDIQTRFTLKSEAVDNLKLEASSVTKENETRFYRPVVTQTLDFMNSKYGKLIQPQKKKESVGLEDRLFIVDSHGFKTLYEDWTVSNNGEKIAIEPDIRAFNIGQGGLMVFEDPAPRWKSVREDIKEVVMGFVQDETAARQLLGATVMTSDIAHETIHNLHGEGLPEAFMELGVRHYTNELMIELGLHEFDLLLNGKSKTVPSVGYNYLLKKYGDDVHKWFFGQEIDKAVRRDIFVNAELISQHYKLPFKRYLVKDD